MVGLLKRGCPLRWHQKHGRSGKVGFRKRACLHNRISVTIQLNLYQEPYHLLKVRNPWGEKEWNGRASDKDQRFWSTVSAADRQRLGYKQNNDGVFFILWEDFVNYFFMVDICKVNDNASLTSLEI